MVVSFDISQKLVEFSFYIEIRNNFKFSSNFVLTFTIFKNISIAKDSVVVSLPWPCLSMVQIDLYNAEPILYTVVKNRAYAPSDSRTLSY